MSFKSTVCSGHHGPLTSYCSESEALEGAAYAARQYHNHLEPYHCDRCGCWHLRPPRTPRRWCDVCTDRHGEPKRIYDTEGEARRVADRRETETGHTLEVYECRFGDGWHLTKG